MVVADHGESLGEHQEFLHGDSYFDGVVRVPLLLRVPGMPGLDKAIDPLVSHVDILPTVLELVGAVVPGAAAALTPLPVLGVPMEGKIAGGLDALLSMTQMPAGVPVGTLAVGRSGAVNAALLAASILALSNRDISDSLDKFRKNQTESVRETPGDEN